MHRFEKLHYFYGKTPHSLCVHSNQYSSEVLFCEQTKRILELTFLQLRKQRLYSSLTNMSGTKRKMDAVLIAQTNAANNLRSWLTI